MLRRLEPFLYLLIPMLLMGCFFVVPLVLSFKISLFDYSKSLYQPVFIGFENYQRLLGSESFWQALGNTVVLVVGIVPAMLVIPIGLALLVNGQLRGMAFFRALIYLPVIVSMVAVGITWKWLYAHDGIINAFLAYCHLPTVDWLVNPDVALYAVMAVVVWKGVAYYMMMYLAQLQSVSHTLYEAATMDGANGLQKHWYVTLPHLQPTVLLVMIISTIGCLKIFTEMYVMTRGGPLGSTKTLVYYIYEQAFEHLNLGIASAAGFILMAILLGLSVLQIRLFQGQDSTASST